MLGASRHKRRLQQKKHELETTGLSHACETRPLCGVAPKAEKYPSAIVIAGGLFL